MPTASDELRARWDMDTACDHLRARGFTMTPKWTWRPSTGAEPTADDLSAIDYLVFEWDFGGLEPHG